MIFRLIPPVCLLIAVLFAPSTVAGDRYDALLSAYRNLESYDATMQLRIEKRDGRWTMTQTADFHVRYDRDSATMLIDKPEMTVRWTQGQLQLTSQDLPDRFLDMQLPEDARWERVLAEIPMLRQPPLIDAALMAAGQPLLAITGEHGLSLSALPAEPDDPLVRPRLATKTPEGTLILWLDPASSQVTRALFEYDRDPARPDEHLRLWMDYTIHRWNEPLVQGVLDLETHDRQPFDSMATLMRSTPRQSAPSTTTAAPRHPLMGQKAPDFESVDLEVRPFESASLTAPLIIIEFWTTWAKDTHASLTDLKKIADWVQAQSLPVDILTVNVGQNVQQAKVFLERHPELALRTVSDPEYSISESFHVQSVPAIVIIHEGKVVEILTGYQSGKKEAWLREAILKRVTAPQQTP